MSYTHLIKLRPGETVDIMLTELLDNGYYANAGQVRIHWQDRDAPVGEIATKGRELQMKTLASGGRVGPIVVTHR